MGLGHVRGQQQQGVDFGAAVREAARSMPAQFTEGLEGDTLQVSRLEFALQVLDMADIAKGPRCVCTRMLVGVEYEPIVDAKGKALYARGVCLSHGVQTLLYLGPATTPTESELTAQARADIEQLVAMTADVRRLAGYAEEIDADQMLAEQHEHQMRIIAEETKRLLQQTQNYLAATDPDVAAFLASDAR